MARPVLILFAKAPRLGTVKRRLAAGTGAPAALRICRNLLANTLRTMRGLRGVELVVAVAPDQARLRLPAGWRRIGQGQGDLGVRMSRAFNRYRRRRVVLIGADIPALAAGDIRAAVRALGSRAVVFGPAGDGGYYLVAMGPKRPARPFAHVRWSSPHALRDTERNFDGIAIRRLRTLDDLDTLADLKKARKMHCFL